MSRAPGPGIEISKHLVFVNSASSFLYRILSVAVLLWAQQYLVRRVTTEEYELLPVITALVVFLPLLTTMFVAGLRRYLTDAYARADEAEVTRLVSTMVPILLRVAGGLLALGAVGSWYVDHLLRIAPEYVGQARLMLFLLVSSLALRVVASPFGLGFELRQRFVARNAIGLAAELLRTGALVGLLLHSPRVMWVVVASFAATVLEVALVTVVSRRLVPSLRYERSARHRESARALMTFGGWSVLSQLAFMVREAADPLILNRLAGSAATGAFNLGALADRHVRVLLLNMAASTQPVLIAMNATDQAERLRRTYLRLCRYSLLALVLLSAPLIVFRQELFRLFIGDERLATYAAAPAVMALLMARAVVIFPNAFLGMVTVAKTAVREMALRNCTLSALNLALTFYLVGARGMGAVGSALATFCVTIVGAPLLNWTLGLRLTGARPAQWWRQTVLPGMVPVLVALPVWIAWHRLAPPASWPALVLAGASGAGVYLLAALATSGREERAQLAAYLRRLRGWA